jgi:hypothetical protein
VATTGMSAMAVALVPHRVLPFTLDLSAWSTKGGAYLRTHARAEVWSVALVFVVAVLFAYGLYLLRARRKPAEFDSTGDVWINSIGTRPADKHPYVGLQLNDGSFIGGALHAFTFGRSPANVTWPCPVLSGSHGPVKQRLNGFPRLTEWSYRSPRSSTLRSSSRPRRTSASRKQRPTVVLP